MPKQARKFFGGVFLVIFAVITLFPALAVADELRLKIHGNVVFDQAGRKLAIDRPYSRIISLYGAHTENLFRLGLNDSIIGVSRHETFPPGALEKPVFSYHDDLEKFLAARPDLVLIRPMIDRGYARLVKRLEQNGITVVSLQPATVEKMHTYWSILGALTSRQNRAQKMTAHFRQAVRELKLLTDSMPAKKKVYFEAIHSKMKTFTPDAMAVFALETAGGINVAQDAKPVRNTNIAYYGKEKILSHGPEIDVFLAQRGAMNRPSIALIKNEPGFQVIKAVADNQIYIIDEQIVSRPTFRLLDGIRAIGRILYPEVFKENADEIVQRAKQF